MKITRRLLSLLLAVSILVGLYIFPVHAAEAVKITNIGSTGTLTGIPAGMNVTYLSDIYNTSAKKYSYVVPGGDGAVRDFALDQNFFGTRVYAFTAANDSNRYAVTKGASNLDADGYRTLSNGVKVHYSDIVLGRNTTIFEKGLAFQPSALNAADQATVIFDISSLDAEYFYAVAGMTGEGNKSSYQRKINFELYGSKDTAYSEGMTFEKLAYAEGICAWLMGEFNIPISGYNFIKLVAVTMKSNSAAESVWANAAVYSEPKMSVDTQVNWTDAPDGDTSKRPAEIKVQLFAGDAAKSEEVALNEANQWKHTWDKLPYGTYSVKTSTASTNYYDISMTGNNVTATYNRVNLAPAITWDDNNNQYSKRPDEVVVQLYADGAAVDGKTVTLNEGNSWKGAFSDLPKYNAEGNVIAYSINVTAPAYYTAAVNGDAITLTCTFDPNQETTDYSTALTWVGDDANLSERHANVDLQLYADGVAVDGKTASLNEANSWAYKFEGLAKYQPNSTTEIVYSVQVTTAQNFYSFAVAADGAITATYIPMATVDVPVEVVFDDSNDALKLRPETVTAQLYADGVKVDGKTLTLNAANSWTGAWTGLNKWPADRSADIVYTVKAEPAIAQYVATYAAGKLTLKCEPKSSVVASVTWNHGENTKTPTSLDVNLYQNNVWVERKTLNADNNWTHTWEDMPLWDDTYKVGITYSVFAVAPTDYIITNDNGNITLTYQKSNAVKVSTIGKAFSVSGIPSAATDGKTHYLTDLLNGNNSRKVSEYVIDGGSYKSFVNYDGKLQVFYGSGPSQQAIAAPDTVVDGKTYQPTDIVLGAQGKKFADGLSAMASPATGEASYVTFNLSGMDMNKFYGLAGITGLANDKNSGPNATNKISYALLTFEVWGSTDNVNFVKLAYAEGVRSWLVAEFDVDITGYSYLKLVTRNTGTTNVDAAFAWADACVYTTATSSGGGTGGGNTGGNEGGGTGGGTTPTPEITAPHNYTASTDGTYTGIKAKDGKVTYLSEKSDSDATKGKYITGYYVVPGGGSTAVRYPTLDTAFGKTTNIIIGAKDAEFIHGLGVLPSHGTSPSDKLNYILLDISAIADVDRFYAVAGMTGTGTNKNSEQFAARFEVWGSKNVTTDPADASFELLAISTDVFKQDSGEFNVNIEGYKTLKLAAFAAEDNPGKANSNIQSAWANACVYKYDANGTYPDPPIVDDGTLPGVYTASADGSYKWITNAKDGKVTYLSNLQATESANSSSNAPTTKNYPYGEPANKIIIGGKNTKFSYGLGVHPKSGTGVAYTTYDLTGLDVDRFYAAVGITNEKGKSGNSQGVIFEVYVDYDGKGIYKQLAESDVIVLKNSGEFHCDIKDAKSLKLVVMSATGDHASSASAWANACVYKYDENGSAPASNTSTGASNNTGTVGTLDNTWLKPTDGFTVSTDGEYAGVPKEKGKSIIYLSDLDYIGASNTTNSAYPFGQPTTLDHPYNSLSELMTLGEMDRVFFKGLGMHPKNPKSPVEGSIDSWTIYDVSKLDCDRFYAAVGLSNEKGKEGASKGVIFKVYADFKGDGNYKLLAHSGCIDGRESGEFDLDITGAKTLKLVTVCASSSHTSSAAGWGNACVYNSKYEAKETEPVEYDEIIETNEAPESTVSTEAPESTEAVEEQSAQGAPVVVIISGILLLLIAAAVIVLLMLKKKAKV